MLYREVESKIKEHSSQLEQKTNKIETQNLQTQLNNLVLESGNPETSSAEIKQARGEYEVLNDRLNDGDIFKFMERYNHFNYLKATQEKFNSSGFVISDVNYRLSEYIVCNYFENVYLKFPSNATYSVFCIFYDINKSILEINQIANWSTSAIYKVPTNAKYVRFSFRYAEGWENLVTLSSINLDKFYSYNQVFLKDTIQPKLNSFDMMSLDNYKKVNYFNKETINLNYRLQDTGAIVGGQTNWITSAFISVNSGDIVNAKITNSATYGYRVCEYDESKTLVKLTKVDQFKTDFRLVTSTTTKYIRFDFKIADNWENTVMLLINNELTTEFIPYDYFDFKNFKHIDTETNKRLDNLEKITHNSNFFLPNEIYIKKGRNGKRRIRKENVLVAYNDKDFYINREESVKYNVAKEYLIANDASAGRQGLPLFISDTRTKQRQYYNLGYINVVDSAINPTSQKNVLIIGDSFTDGGYLPCETKNILVNEMNLTNLNFIGHKEDTDGAVVCKNCGIGGITLLDFIKKDNSLGRPEYNWNNPFLFDGAISFSKYLTNNGFSNQLDYVVIECGVNDIGTFDATPSTVRDRAKEMIDNIHLEFPNCKVFLVGQKYASQETDYVDAYIWNNKIMEMNRLYQELCESAEYSATCTYVDIALMFDIEYGTPYEMKPVYKGSDEMIRKITDWLHPNICGYYMIAENIACAIASKL